MKSTGREETLWESISVPGAWRTHVSRWWERVLTAPPVLSRQLLALALRNRHPAITNELPAEPPLFVLTTGRTGTYTLAAVLAVALGIRSYHEPLPDLYNLGRQVHQKPESDGELVLEALQLARASLWQAANLAGRRYVEASNHVTFLSPFLLDMMPEARFLHFTRAPASYAQSATGFGWYTITRTRGNRHSPRPGSTDAAAWESRDAFSKNVWYWREVNSFARDFLMTLPPGQGLHLRSEDIFATDPVALRQLFALVDSEVPSRHRIDRVLGQQLNAGRYRSGARPVQDLTATQREILEQECGQLARDLGYSGVEG